MSTYGRQLLGTSGRPIMVAASETEDIDWKIGGITLDWALITAVSVLTTLLDDTVVAIGQKFLRYGQILCRVRSTEVQTVTVTPGSTPGGTFTLAGSAALAYNVTAAAMQAALETVFGAGMVTVSGTAPYTITFDDSLGNVTSLAVVDSMTGTGHGVVVATVNQGGADLGKYGPYDPAATDGRQLLTPGDCFILNQTVLENGVIPGLGGPPTDHPAVFDGGVVWKARILMTSGTHSLAAGPTVAEIQTAFPRLQYVQS